MTRTTTLCFLLLSTACSSKTEDPATSKDSGIPSVILDGGGSIPDPPDGSAACQSGSCNYQSQDCPSGQTCVPSASPPATGDWPPTCENAGTVGEGQPCSGWNDCAAGSFCVGVSQDADGGVQPGTCRRLCCGGDWTACGVGQSCIQQLYLVRPGGGDPVYANADVCAPVGTCDVLDPKSCSDPNRSCQIVDPVGNVACAPAGTAAIGAGCSEKVSCVAGASCVGGTCRRLCKAELGLPEPPCPTEEGVCVHFKRDPEGVGECTHVQ